MTLLEWVESAGGNKNNIIDTGFIFKTDSRVVMDVYIYDTAYSAYMSFAGVRNTTPNLALYSRFNGTNNFTVEYNNTAKVNTTATYGSRITVTITGLGVTFGEQSVSFTLSENTQENFKIFGCGFSGAASSEQPKVRLYSCQIFDGNMLVRNFVPAINDSNVVCLYDTVNAQYYYVGNGVLTAGPEIQASYTIMFDANGGTGTMADQIAIVDIPTPLAPNTFTRSGYYFAGWSTTQDGDVEYTDGQSVTNLAPEDESITLYAVWRVPQLTVTLQTNKSENNRMDKEIDTIASYTGVLKQETSIIDPVLLIECNLLNVVNCNYITIPWFNRSYFVNNIRSVRQGLVEFSCHVDVLSSFANEIRGCSGIVARNEGLYDLYLRDPEIQQLARPRFQQLLFEDGYEPDVDDVSYILAVV